MSKRSRTAGGMLLLLLLLMVIVASMVSLSCAGVSRVSSVDRDHGMIRRRKLSSGGGSSSNADVEVGPQLRLQFGPLDLIMRSFHDLRQIIMEARNAAEENDDSDNSGEEEGELVDLLEEISKEEDEFDGENGVDRTQPPLKDEEISKEEDDVDDSNGNEQPQPTQQQPSVVVDEKNSKEEDAGDDKQTQENDIRETENVQLLEYVHIRAVEDDDNGVPQCLSAANEGEHASIERCDPSKKIQLWHLDEADDGKGKWRLSSRSDPTLCLALLGNMKACDPDKPKQLWTYDDETGWIISQLGHCLRTSEAAVLPCTTNMNEWEFIDPEGLASMLEEPEKQPVDPEPEPVEPLPEEEEQEFPEWVLVRVSEKGQQHRCLTAGEEGEQITVETCKQTWSKQRWHLERSAIGGLSWSPLWPPNMCIAALLKMKQCVAEKDKQKWHYVDGQISNQFTGLCLTDTAEVLPCKDGAYKWDLLDIDDFVEPDAEIEPVPEPVEPESEPEEPEPNTDPEPEEQGPLKECARQQLRADDGGKGKKFGMHAVVDNDTIVVVDFDHPVENVFVYKRNAKGKWKFKSKIDTDDRKAGDNFQYVDISGQYVAVSAKRADSNGKEDSGAVFVFKEQGDGKYEQVAKLAPSDLKAGDWFGNNISMDGDTLLVGARYQNNEKGVVYAFRNSKGKWKEYGKKLIPSEQSNGDQFGRRINFNGDTAVIGALNSGIVYVFQDTGSGFEEVQELVPADKDEFGFKVDIDRDTIVVGAQKNGKGSTYVFTRNNNDKWSQAAKLEPEKEEDDYLFAADVAIEGNTILVNALSDGGSGLVYVFTRNGNKWKQQPKLTAENSKPSREDGFGDSLAIQAGTAVLGAPADNGLTGSVYIVDLC